MPGFVGDIPVRDHQLGPAEPAEVPDDLHQTRLQSNSEIVVHRGVDTNPEDHSFSIVREYLHLDGGGVSETLLVNDVILEIAGSSEVRNLHVNPFLASFPLEAQRTVTVEAGFSINLDFTFCFVLAGIILTQNVNLNKKDIRTFIGKMSFLNNNIT